DLADGCARHVRMVLQNICAVKSLIHITLSSERRPRRLLRGVKAGVANRSDDRCERTRTVSWRMYAEVAEMEQVKDIVCGAALDPHDASIKTEYGGQLYFFCSPACQRTFDENPGRYLSNL